MKTNKILVSLVAMLVLVLAISSVSAFADITSVNVNDGDQNAVMAGETIKVRVGFTAYDNASDVRLKVWLSGARENQVATERFDVYEGSTYSRTVAVQVPYDIDPTESLILYIDLESRNGGIGDAEEIELKAQRESYIVEILDANMDSKVQAGSNLGMNIVLKNRGAHFAEDTFLKVKIPTLGVEQRAYFGDLSPVDQANPDKEDAVERRMLVSIPSDAKPGIYTVELEAYNGDSSTVLTKKLVIVGASEDTMVYASSQSRTFAANEKGIYTLTLVNSGNKIKVYNLAVDSSNADLSVNMDDTVVAVPAGTSKTVKLEASAARAGTYNFAVNVISGDEIVQKEAFTANVQGSSAGSSAFTGSTAVVLTIVLVIIFVVLLVVLIVLLTRKPEKQEAGESYY